jgi:hypothetical protein
MRAEDVLDKAEVHAVSRKGCVFGIDEEALAADWTTDAGGEFRRLA